MPPVLRKKIEPDYSESGRKAELEGIVLLFIVIEADGVVGNITLQQGMGYGLDEQAAEAVRQWRFQPATKNGSPVAMKAEVEVGFRMIRDS